MLIPTALEQDLYIRDGYYIRKGLLTEDEVINFRDHARAQLEAEGVDSGITAKGDKDGKKTLLKLWNSAGNDKYGLLARDERLVRLAEGVIGKETYLYSHKMTMKQPNEGGAWEWHQDFGYWYNNGCLAPEMMSIYISLDRANKANGCLQVLKGSHSLGRLDHIREDGQTNVNRQYMDAALERFDHLYIEMEAGDALLFHCNLLHRSDANNSDTYRWGYICSYNSVENAPFIRAREYGNLEPLHVVPASSFMGAA